MEVPAHGEGRSPAALHHHNRLQLPEVGHGLAAAFLLVALAALCPAAEVWSGKVAAVKDGDTLEILKGRTPVIVRLYGIDCPELNQPFGPEARRAASDLSLGKSVTVAPRSRDRYGRTVATITLPGGADLSQTLLSRGLAWWYRKYAASDLKLRLLEQTARDRRLGLWRDPNPIPPWGWRGRASPTLYHRYQ